MGRVLKRQQNAAEIAWAEHHAQELREWNNALAKVIRYAIRTTSVSDFAKRIHYTRSTLSTLLHQELHVKQRPWTLDNLIAIADALGCPLSELFVAAGDVRGKPEAVPSLRLRLAGTAPRSRERLQRLIYEAVEYDGDWDKTHCDQLLEVTYRLRDVECANPDFCRAYYEGTLSDGEALAALKAAWRYTDRPNEEPYPLWAALRETYGRQV